MRVPRLEDSPEESTINEAVSRWMIEKITSEKKYTAGAVESWDMYNTTVKEYIQHQASPSVPENLLLVVILFNIVHPVVNGLQTHLNSSALNTNICYWIESADTW